MGLVLDDDGWQIPDELWVAMAPLLPARKPHPLGCHNPRVPDRNAMNAILLVLRTGCQWQSLRAGGVCSPSSAYRRFREWLDAGVFLAFWQNGLLQCEAMSGIDWDWLSMDGAMSKAPLGGEKNGPQSDGSGQTGDQAQRHDGWERPASWARRRRREPHDFKMARYTLESLAIPKPVPTPEAPQGLCLDKGYDYAEFVTNRRRTSVSTPPHGAFLISHLRPPARSR